MGISTPGFQRFEIGFHQAIEKALLQPSKGEKEANNGERGKHDEFRGERE